MNKIFNLLVILSLFTSSITHAKDVIYPGNDRTDYLTELLSHALSYSEDSYITKGFGTDIPKHRAFELMTLNQGIDVMFGGSTPERETRYLPIYIPLMKGLYGWRISLIHKNQPRLLANVNNLVELQMFTAGQFNTWSDTRVLRANKLTVATSSDYAGLYTMLHKKRFDFFPRSIIEIEGNYQDFKHLDITIEPHILIHYPSAYYFYVRKDNVVLANAIESGLNQALTDGSFDKLFYKYYGEIIKDVAQQKRRVVALDNPYLSSKTPLENRKYWLTFN